MLKEVTKKIEVLEKRKTKLQETLSRIDSELLEINEEMKPLIKLKEQFEKVNAEASALLSKNNL